MPKKQVIEHSTKTVAMFPPWSVLKKVAQVINASTCELAREPDVVEWLESCRRLNWISDKKR